MDKLLTLPAAAAGAILGSFLCLAIARFPARPDSRRWFLRLHRPASRCDHCGMTLRWRDLIPLLSWLWLRGRCRDCHHPVACHHFAIEAVCTLGLAFLVLVSPSPALFIWLALFSGMALVLSEIDRRRLLLPDILTGPLLWFGLTFHIALYPERLVSAVAGAVLGYMVLRALGEAYALWRRRQGIGRGDAKYLAAIGAWTGVFALPQIITAAALLSLTVWLLTRKWRDKTARQPFGPCLSLAGWWMLMVQYADTGWLAGVAGG